jgi:citrate synthase
MNEINVGLEGVLVGRTSISNVDGEQGRLSYRGEDIESLAARPFLQVIWLLLFGDNPSAQQEQQLAQFLLAHRDLGQDETNMLAALPIGTHPMLMLQALVPVLDLTSRANLAVPFGGDDALHGLIIAARLPTLIAAWYNRQNHRQWPVRSASIEPQRAFLKSLHAREPDPLQVAALDCVQILQLEHSYNAGTFAGRVTLSTQAPIQSSIAASIGTLFGNLHGGADQAALEFAQTVGSPENAAQCVSDVLAGGGRIMGMGHREYRTVDPRATLLKPLARRLCENLPDSARLLATLEAIEASCTEQLEKPGKPIRANVEFYKGAVFHALGIPSHYFTAMFASARVYGYIAHALEFRPQARLIRPRAEYRAA